VYSYRRGAGITSLWLYDRVCVYVCVCVLVCVCVMLASHCNYETNDTFV